jgi:hypothetical protein
MISYLTKCNWWIIWWWEVAELVNEWGSIELSINCELFTDVNWLNEGVLNCGL